MIEYKLQYKSKISYRNSKGMILLFVKYGNHYHRTRFETDADVKRAFAFNDVDFKMLVTKCRNYQEHVPFFENLIGSSMTVSDGATASRFNWETKEEDLVVQGP